MRVHTRLTGTVTRRWRWSRRSCVEIGARADRRGRPFSSFEFKCGRPFLSSLVWATWRRETWDGLTPEEREGETLPDRFPSMLPLLEEQKQKKRAAAKSKKKKKRADLEWCDKSRVFALPSLTEIYRLLSDTRNARDKHEDDLKQESVLFLPQGG